MPSRSMNDLSDHFLFLVIVVAAEETAAGCGVAFDLERRGELLSVDGEYDAIHAGGEQGWKSLLACSAGCAGARGSFTTLTGTARTALWTAGLRAGRCVGLSASRRGWLTARLCCGLSDCRRLRALTRRSCGSSCGLLAGLRCRLCRLTAGGRLLFAA